MINPPQVLPEEPTAVTPHGGFCGGKSQQWLRYPTKPHARICEGESRMAELLDRNWHCAARAGPPCSLPGQPYSRHTLSDFAGITRISIGVDSVIRVAAKR